MSRITDVISSSICPDSDDVRECDDSQKCDVTDVLSVSASSSDASYIETDALTTHSDYVGYSSTSATQAGLIQQSCEKYTRG